MDVIIRIIQVILALSLLVLVHEFGHYIFAKLFKIRVEKFYLFFPPAIFKYKPRKSDTEFGIGMIPLGGFCKISGMIDESMDKEAMKQPPQPWEFRTKPAWQRLFVMAGGVLMNIVLAIVLYTAILFTWGEEYIKTEDAIYGVEVNNLSEEIGFCSGDRIIAFDKGSLPDNFSQLQVEIVRNDISTVTVVRGNDTLDIKIDPLYIPAILNTPGMFLMRTPIAVGGIPDTSINYNSGLQMGDKIIKVGQSSAMFYKELQSSLLPFADSSTTMTVNRNGEQLQFPINVNKEGKAEIFLQSDISGINITQHQFSLFEAIPAGFARTFETLGNYIKELGLIFSPKTEAYKSVGSFISIGQIFPKSWNWEIFWNITALLSVMLAVMNLLPIPALDGGHILFTLFEMITGRKPSVKFMEIAQITGMIFLLLLMFFAFGNDIMRLVR